MTRRLALGLVALLALAPRAGAQSITLPPDGDNQRSEVTQQIGLVTVSVAYGSPDVHAPNGDDRRGKIFGTLVPARYLTTWASTTARARGAPAPTRTPCSPSRIR